MASTEINRELAEWDWLGAVVWDDDDPKSVAAARDHSKLILEQTDKHMIFEGELAQGERMRMRLAIKEQDGGGGLTPYEKELMKNSAQLDAKKRKLLEQKIEKSKRLREAMKDIDMDQQSKDKKRDEIKSKEIAEARRVRNTVIKLHHSQPALKLQMIRGELPLVKARFWHRPRSRPWMRPQAGAGAAAAVVAATEIVKGPQVRFAFKREAREKRKRGCIAVLRAAGSLTQCGRSRTCTRTMASC
jgi:hypothetical protein